MKYLKKMTALMVLGCFFSLNCSAAGIYNVKYDADLGKATISGNTAQPNVNVTLEVLKQGNSSDVLKDLKPENASNVILRYDQCMSDDEGAFEFSFKLPGNSASGEYVTRVAWGGSAADNRLVYVSPTDLTQALYNVNNATDKEFTAAFENAVKKFGLENQYYTELSETEKSFIISAVKENRGSGYESAGDFTEVFSEALAIAAVNDIAAGYDALGTVEYFEDILELKKLTSYATFSKQSKTVKKQIIEAASADGRVNDLEAFREKVEEKTVIFSLNNVQGYDEVDEVLQDNNHILNIDFTAYNNLSNKSVVNKKMTEVSFTSLNEIVSKFNSFVTAQKKSESSSYHGGGTGGGGGRRLPNIFFDVEDETSTPSKTESFNDLDGVEWARESIEFLAERNIICGKGDNRFEPMSSVTRAEFVKMLVVALGIENNSAECNFKDVEKDDWYYRYVASAVENNLVYGISDNLFGSTTDISKEDVATLLLRAGERQGMKFDNPNTKNFKDHNEISDYAVESVEKLSAVGIISGTDTGYFEPKKSATRAEAAVMIVKFLDLSEGR